MKTVDTIAERLRQEPYHLLSFRRSNCIGKALRFREECRRMGIEAGAVVCIGLARVKPFGFWIWAFTIHAWGEIDGERIETTRPLEKANQWGGLDVNTVPIISMRIR